MHSRKLHRTEIGAANTNTKTEKDAMNGTCTVLISLSGPFRQIGGTLEYLTRIDQRPLHKTVLQWCPLHSRADMVCWSW